MRRQGEFVDDTGVCDGCRGQFEILRWCNIPRCSWPVERGESERGDRGWVDGGKKAVRAKLDLTVGRGGKTVDSQDSNRGIGASNSDGMLIDL